MAESSRASLTSIVMICPWVAAQGLAQADLGGALGHRHEHDVHDQDARHHQADGGDPGHGQGQRP